MDIKKRINARKIVLSYFYQHCFFSVLSKKPFISENTQIENPILEDLFSWDKKSTFLDEDFLKVVAQKKQAELHIDEFVQAKLNEYASDYSVEEEFDYMLRYFFDQRNADEVDVEYVLQVGNALSRYEAELIQKVDQYAESFWYEKMDPMDQVLLLLWYIEYKVIATPKEVILNEMVELAKRYSDEWAPKLVNGVLQAILSKEE